MYNENNVENSESLSRPSTGSNPVQMGRGLVGAMVESKKELSPLQKAFQVQHVALETLQKIITLLEERLSPAMMPESPNNEESAEEPHESDLVAEVQDVTQRIYQSNRKISDILKRLTI